MRILANTSRLGEWQQGFQSVVGFDRDMDGLDDSYILGDGNGINFATGVLGSASHTSVVSTPDKIWNHITTFDRDGDGFDDAFVAGQQFTE